MYDEYDNGLVLKKEVSEQTKIQIFYIKSILHKVFLIDKFSTFLIKAINVVSRCFTPDLVVWAPKKIFVTFLSCVFYVNTK